MRFWRRDHATSTSRIWWTLSAGQRLESRRILLCFEIIKLVALFQYGAKQDGDSYVAVVMNKKNVVLL